MGTITLMAKVLASWQPHTPTGTRYPWHEWADGRIWELKRGEDFPESLTPRDFTKNARAWARRNGRKVKARGSLGAGIVVLQFEAPPAR